MSDKRKAAIEAVAVQRAGGDPARVTDRDRILAEPLVDDLMAALSVLAQDAEPPEVLESRTGERVVTYDLRKADDT